MQVLRVAKELMKMEGTTELSDEELTELYLAGDQSRYFELVERYETKVFNTALYLTDKVEEAESVLTEVFLELAERLKTDDGKTPLFAWLLQLTLDKSVHALITANASKRGALPDSITLATPFEEHSEAYERRNQSLRFAFQSAVSELSSDAKIAFVLRDIHGKKITEIAEFLDQTVFEVRGLIRQARRAIGGQINRILERAA